ncbi:uncharacterized protein LOC108664726 [Hyalella azteca]|uniref:Uncharacterized protein LOC108664726 n=1 Tax=Hyalella azteca TaxID=294128 RepID=A0A979FT12_HYAAZ|nr:uncharacterized protein LOC108664726 [Hyalella azteca]
MNRLALASGLMLNRTLRRYSISAEDLRKLVTTIQNTAGSTAKAKLMLIKNKVFEVASGGGTTLDLNAVPDELLSVAPLQYLDGLSITSRISALGRNASYNTAQMATLISGIGSDRLSDVPSNAKEALPTKIYKDLSKGELLAGAVGMLPSSKMGLTISDKTFKTAVNMNLDADAAMFIQKMDVFNIPPSDIIQQLEYMKDVFPSIDACWILQLIYMNYSKMEMLVEWGENGQLLTPYTIELMPLCVATDLSRQNRIGKLDEVSKRILLERLVLDKKIFLTYRSITEMGIEEIIYEGLRAKGWPSVLTGADVKMYGELLLFFPLDLLNAVTAEGLPILIEIFNSLASSVLMPCLSRGTQEAVENLIFKYKGDDPQTWRQISEMCCLLYILSPETISRIPRGALMSCRCHIADRAQYSSDDDIRELECPNTFNYGIEFQRKNVLRAQARAALDILDLNNVPGYNPSGRRKRAVSNIALCNRASVSGADDISNGELSAASPNEIMECLAALGERYMNDSKAQVLANKVRDSLSPRSWSSLTNDLMRDMNFIMKGIPANEIRDLPAFSPPTQFYDAVVVLGNEKMMFSDDQVTTFQRECYK